MTSNNKTKTVVAGKVSGFIVNIDVPNVQAGIEFYTTGLGFNLKRTLFERSVAELAMGEARVYLIEQQEGTQPIPDVDVARSFKRHWTPVHLDVIVDDIDAAVTKALEAGAVQSGERTIHSWGRLAPLSDPFGNGICLLQFSEGGYDSVAD